MFLFILESISTSELMFIAVVALIIFGPRKLPQMFKTFGKTIAEFKNATNEFKATWEKEVSFEESEVTTTVNPSTGAEVSRAEILNQINLSSPDENQFAKPTIRELTAIDIAEKFPDKNQLTEKKNSGTSEKVDEKLISDKREWL
ncbi:MAG: Sec-independent protein translocase subunit TatA/TatB [Pyrinomonadaceae bacterium]